MSLKKKIAQNIGFVSIAEALSTLLSLLLVILISRELGVEGLGLYSFAFAFAGLFIIVYDFGVSTFFIKEVASNKANAQKHFGHYASLKLIFCLIAMLLPMVTILFLNRGGNEVMVVWLAALTVFFQNYSYVQRNAFQAFQEMRYEAYVRMTERVVAFSLGAYALLNGYGLTGLMVAFVFSSAVSLVYSIVLLRKIGVSFILDADMGVWKKILKVSWPFWLSAVFIQLYFYIDTVMLTFMKGYAATGIYNAAYKLIGVISKVPMILVLVLFPVMSELHSKLSKDLLRQVLEKGVHVLIALSLPLMVGTTLLADRLIRFVYKQGFMDSSIVLSLLIWTVFFTFLSFMLGWFLNATNKHLSFAYVTGTCLFINFFLNLALIPKYSFIGASVATVATSMVNLLLLAFVSAKAGYKTSIVRMSLRPLLGAIAMGAFIFFFGANMHLLLLIPLSAGIYFIMLVLIGDIKREDLTGIL